MGNQRKTPAERKAFEKRMPKTVYWACGTHPKGHRRRSKAEFCKEKYRLKALKVEQATLKEQQAQVLEVLEEIQTPEEFQSTGFQLAQLRKRLDERTTETAAF